ncbi:MAG: ATP-binding protein [Terriglobales bacterium]
MFRITARTVLELGSELISSDIIAFYELIKNAFDAKSKSGADILFQIVLRRNSYLKLRTRALDVLSSQTSRTKDQEDNPISLADLINDSVRSVEIGASSSLIETFKSSISDSVSVDDFVRRLDRAYADLNTIEIADTGEGMSLEDLSKNYLTIGTPSRKREIDRVLASGASQMPYLGEKGIGRLSVMRLGDRLRLETARTQDSHLNVLEVDWSLFADLDAMVEDIKVTPTRGDKKERPSWSGTRLVIGSLSEDWTEKRVRDFSDYDFARLTDPFLDPKNRPRIALHWNGNRIAIPWMDRALVEHAHALFRGRYSADPEHPELSVRMEALNLGFTHPPEADSVTLTLPDLEGLFGGPNQEVPLSSLSTVGSFEFEAYWYNRRYLVGIDTIGNQRAVRELQRKWSGIMLFRDGFRVFPYGEDEDDWLGLDRKALSRPGYVLNKAQFVGHVQISRAGNPRLVDQTNREGLRATPEQQVFVALLQHVVRDMLWDFFREVDRRHRKAPLDLGDVKAQITSLENRARNALSRVRKFVPKTETEILDDLQHAFTEFRDLSMRAQQKIEQVEEDSRQMVQMAGVGLMVEVIAHELARASEGALEAIEGLRGKQMSSEITSRLETLRAEMKTVSKRLRVLDQLSVSGRQRSEVFDLGEVVSDLKDGHSLQLRRDGVLLNIEKPAKPIRVKTIKGMVVQVLENLLSNSLYWLKVRSNRPARFVPTVTIRIEANPPTLYFKDNGPGISPDHRERIFRPFWSLKEKSQRRGLGLFIARENANYLGGQLILSETADPKTGRLNEFIFELSNEVAVR